MKVLIKKTNKVEEVKDSYALNFLLPKGLAVKVAGQVEKQLAEKETKREEEREKLKIEQGKILAQIKDKTFEIKAKCNDKGELYAGIGEEQIKKLIGAKGTIRGLSVQLLKPIKEVGEYQVSVKAGSAKQNWVVIKLRVMSDK